jgi:hypothetical protein
MDIRKWKANVTGAAEAADNASRLLVMSRRAAGVTRAKYAAEAAHWLAMGAKMANTAAAALSPPKPAPKPKTPAKAKPKPKAKAKAKAKAKPKTKAKK